MPDTEQKATSETVYHNQDLSVGEQAEYDQRMALVIERFILGIPQRINNIKESLCNNDWQNVKLLSHRLAGAKMFGFPELGHAAKKIENAVDNQELSLLDQLLKELEETSQREIKEKELQKIKSTPIAVDSSL